MTRPTPELLFSKRRIQPGYTMVSITSLRGLRRMLQVVVVLQVVNLVAELRGLW
jgi:hypothetical protein